MNFICSEVENMNISTKYYEFIKQIYENVSKYLKKYKDETLEYYKKISKIHEKYDSKINSEEILKNNNNIEKDHILYLTNLIFNVIQSQLTYLNIFLKEVDDVIKSFDKTLKEKNTMSSGYMNEYEDCKNSLQKKYKEIEKAKKLFFDNANITENLLIDFYTPRIPNCKTQDTPFINRTQVDNIIKVTKKNENDYANVFKSAKNYEDKFFSLTSNSTDNMKRVSCDLTTKMKDNIVSFLLNLKNYFKLSLGEIDTYLPELVNLDENKKIEEIIYSSFKKDNKLNRIELEKYKIKSISNSIEDNTDENYKYLIEDQEIINTVNEMEKNFNLIVKGSIEEINSPEKLRCRLLTYKLFSFSKKMKDVINNLEKDKNVNNDENKNYSITDEEVKELYELLKKSENRIIFIRKLNNFRKYGSYEFPTREFYILSNIFIIIINYFEQDKNSEIQFSLVILSETYYKMENDEKVYILSTIKGNKLFHEINFWNDYINTSILKEVERNLKIDLRYMKKNTQTGNKKRNFDKLVFAQMFPIIKTILEFELEDDKLNKLIENLVSYYNIDETSKKILFEMINFKGTENKKEINEKTRKYINMSCIEEDENEFRQTVFENVEKINNLVLKRNKEKEEKEEKKEEDENEEQKEEPKEEQKEENKKEEEKDEDEKVNEAMIFEGVEEEEEVEDNK